MEQNPHQEANSSSAIKYIPYIYNSPQLVPIMSLINPVQPLQFGFLG